jgi:hypothetical protein
VETVESIAAGTRVLLAAVAETDPEKTYYSVFLEDGFVAIGVGIEGGRPHAKIKEKTLLAATISVREQVIEMAREKIQKAEQVANLLKEIR